MGHASANTDSSSNDMHAKLLDDCNVVVIDFSDGKGPPHVMKMERR